MKIAISLLRTLVGGLFIGHGTQKLFGWFGGGGPDATGQFFESAGLRPGKRNALAAGTSEAVGGLLFTLNRGMPVASTVLAGTMFAAIWAVHKDTGPWAADGGWEYNAVLLAVFATILEEEHGTPFALATIAAGAAGAVGAFALSPGEEGGGPVEAATGTESTQA